MLTAQIITAAATSLALLVNVTALIVAARSQAESLDTQESTETGLHGRRNP